jgi:chromate transporter
MAGWPGLIVAGVSFILPAAAIVLAVAWAYVRFGALPQAAGILYGVKPVVIAVVLQAMWNLGRTAVKTRWLGALGVGAVVAAAVGVNELVVLLAVGFIAALRVVRPRASPQVAASAFLAAAAPQAFGLWPLFLVFLKIGAVLFGSGYVLVAFMRADLVEHLHWLTDKQLIDAVAVGQITPGPVFTTATFVGYVLGGGAGALVATIGIFLPAFIFVAASGPLVPKLRRSRVAGAVLDGVNVASLALMAVVTAQIARTALVDWITVVIAIVSAVALVKWRVNSTWLVLGGALLGALI